MAKVTTDLFGVVALMTLPVQAPMKESMEWLTDIIDSHNGTESRLKLRSAPRCQLQYDIPQQVWQRSEAYNTERGALRRKWAVPVWSQVQHVGTVLVGATDIPCNTTLYDLRADSLALLYQSTTSWQVVEISAVDGDSITVGATQAFVNAYLVPLRIGYIRGDAKRKSNGHTAVTSLAFDLDDNIAISSADPTQYLGNDIYFDEVLMDGDTYDSVLQAQEDRADYDIGLVDRRAPWLYTRNVMSYLRMMTTPAEVLAFRQFVHRRAGKYRAFWAPTYENDLRKASTGTITTTFRFRKDSYGEWAQDRVHVAFEDDAGNWYPRALSNLSTVDSTTLQATLSSALNLPASRIKRVSYLGLKRLTADNVEMDWIGNGVCRAMLSVTELSP